MRTILTHSQLASHAPSIFAKQPASELSDRYSFVSTGDVILSLIEANWHPVQASQKRSRNTNNRAFAKHLVRLGNPDLPAIITKSGAIHPEIVLVNSHDGSSSWQLMAGLFRMVCSNGLITADTMFEQIRLRHNHATLLQQVSEATQKVIDVVPMISERIERMTERQLTFHEQLAFAEKALAVKFNGRPPISPEQALMVRRVEDEGTDLWTTYNVVQENLMHGGLDGRAASGRRVLTRAVRDINMDVQMNKAFWELTEAV
jgi:hypothetical protein